MRKESACLYRDHGLRILRTLSGPEVECIRKRIIQIFNPHMHKLGPRGPTHYTFGD